MDWGVASIDANPSGINNNANQLQIAPSESRGPEFGELKEAWSRCLGQSQSFVDQVRQNYLTRYALWAGQSSDSKKWAREGSKVTPTPWEGASDQRVYLTDDAINKKVALLRMAFKRAHLIAEPVTGNDLKRAKIVTDFMRWLMHTQMPELDREIKLLANYIYEKGIGATGQFWEVKQEKTLTNVSIAQMQQRFPDIDMMAVIMDDSMEETLTDMFEREYGCTAAKARRMLKDLRTDGTTTVATLGRRVSRPVLRAFDLSEQLFIPPDTTDIENASGIYRVEYYTPEALRAFVVTDGWDEAWVEAAIESCMGKQIVMPPSQYMQPINRSFVYQTQSFLGNQVPVVYAYQRMSDEDGVPGIYLTIFNPMLPPSESPHRHKGYAKFSLLDYAHGNYPFVLYRREYLSRRLHDTRGLPEPGKSWQDAIKAHIDSRIDAASIAIIPPLGFPMGRPPSRWGPGARVPERRPGEYHFLDKPTSDPLTEQSQTVLEEYFRAYCGFQSTQGDPQYAQLVTQNETDEFLSSLADAFCQIFCLYQQYGDDRVTFRVLGLRDATSLEFVKGDPGEFYRFWFAFDTQSTNPETAEKKWNAIIQGINVLNRNGNVNFAEALQAYFESIDPTLAERILEPTPVAEARVLAEEQDDLTKIFSGWNIPVKSTTPPQLAMQAIQTYMQSPDVAQRYQSDPAFRERMDARIKQVNFQQQQMQNREIGRQGALMPGPVLPTT